MTFLPIVNRELRVASRKTGTYLTRFFTALVAIGACAWIWASMGRSMDQSRHGSSLFAGLSSLAFAYCLFIGVTTADCISEEKREGTLGLLFLTDLRGFDVVLGKLFASSLNLIYGLLSIFPMLAVPLLLGGVTGEEWFRIVLVLCVTLLFSLTCGIFCSSISRSDRKARGATAIILLGLGGFLPLAVTILSAKYNRNFAEFIYWMVASPPVVFAAGFSNGFQPEFFWISLATLAAVSVLFLVLASLAVPRLWQDNPTGSRASRLKDRFRTLSARAGWNPSLIRRQLLNRTAYLWIASRPLVKPYYVLAFLLVAGFAWFMLWMKYPRGMTEGIMYTLIMVILHTVIKGWVASEATRSFAHDRRSGAMELTLATPLSVKEILQGQWQALVRQFALPAGIVLLADACMIMSGARQAQMGTDASWVSCCIALMVVFVADLVTLAWVGMWLGVSSARPERASGATVGRIMILPWLLFFGLVTFIGLISSPSGRGVTWEMVLAAALLIAFAVDLFFGFSAAQKLHLHFRAVATQRFDLPGQKRRWFRRG